jgi:peptide-methionine (S)-S-oxide reductase
MHDTALPVARRVLAVVMLCGLAAVGVASADSPATALPAPAVDNPAGVGQREQVAYFAGGCYWGVEGVFEHVRGVRQAISGQAAGGVETVKLVFDPATVSYGQLLQVFFSVVHDPTQLDRQGPDVGPRYRSEVLAADATQQRIATAYVAQLTGAHAFASPIVTRIGPVRGFRSADDDQQDYLRRHPGDAYIVRNDMPKLTQLKLLFPALYHD